MAQPLLSDLELVFVNVLGAIWVFSTAIFFYQLIKTGFELMFSGGDTKKTESNKSRIGKLVQGFVITVGAYVIGVAIIAIVGIKDPNGADCFTTVISPNQPIKFQFVFPIGCR